MIETCDNMLAGKWTKMKNKEQTRKKTCAQDTKHTRDWALHEKKQNYNRRFMEAKKGAGRAMNRVVDDPLWSMLKNAQKLVGNYNLTMLKELLKRKDEMESYGIHKAKPETMNRIMCKPETDKTKHG